MLASLFELLAQDSTPNGAGTQPADGSTSTGSAPNIFFGLLLAMIVFYVFLFRGQGKKRKQSEKMIQGLKKNDRIVTIGGIVGTVVATKEDEIVVRVDESSNIKMTFVRQSIQRVLTDDQDRPRK